MRALSVLSAAVGCLFLSSCGGMIKGEVRLPISGVLLTEDGAKIDQATVDSLADKARRLRGGERFDSIIFNPVK